METLEDRRQPSITSYINGAGLLVIHGTEFDDQITVYVDTNTDSIRVTGFYGSTAYSETFAASLFKYPGVKFYGKDGNDYFDNSADLYGEVYGGDGNDTLYGGANFDKLTGGRDDDHLIGFGGDDFIRGNQGNDIIDGRLGDDDLRGDAGDDTIYGDFGYDEIRGGSGNDSLYGGRHDDTIRGSSGNDYILGEEDNDELNGGSDDDLIGGNAGDDTVRGNGGDDFIDGESGQDRLDGDGGNDVIYGGEGNDDILGGSNHDTIYGGNHQDTLYGGSGGDFLYGEDGNDKLYGNSGQDRLYGQAGVDYLDGGLHADGLFAGFSSGETLIGGGGSDRFLRYYTQGDIYDLGGNDALLVFQNGNQSWDEEEILLADEAFYRMQKTAGTARILRDPVTGDPLIFINNSLDGGLLGLNEVSGPNIGYEFNFRKFRWDVDVSYTRTITIADWYQLDPDANTEAISTFIHEVGHNWDPILQPQQYNQVRDEYDNIFYSGIQLWPAISKKLLSDLYPPGWKSFTRIGGWSYKPVSTYNLVQGNHDGEYSDWYYHVNAGESFIRDYGRLNPYEDWATAWEAAFTEPFEGVNLAPHRLQRQKFNIIKGLFA